MPSGASRSTGSPEQTRQSWSCGLAWVLSLPADLMVRAVPFTTRFSSLMQERWQQYHARQHSDQKREHNLSRVSAFC
jgi:hypothetical protein